MDIITKILDFICFGKSRVGAIIDEKGGFRLVITQGWRLKFHVGPGETIFVLPGFVKEPVPWGEIPSLMERAKEYAGYK